MTVGEFRTAGVDLASQDSHTAMAEIRWRAGAAVLESVRMGVPGEAVATAAQRVSIIGIDCPLGWPRPVTDLLIASRADLVLADTARDDAGKQALAYRRTDVVVRERTGRWPLSVSADRIAYPAMRCAGLLGSLRRAGHPVRRSGIGSIVAEVYPAAALRGWQLPTAGYKVDAAQRGAAVDALVARTPWLHWSGFAVDCVRNHDVLDAVVCALVAGAVVLGRTSPPGVDDLGLADEEGWIHLPDADFLDRPDG